MKYDSINLDWLHEDPFFKKIFPSNDLKEHLNMNPDQVDQYVENALREANINSIPMNKFRSKIKHEHMDTHHFLITKIYVPNFVHPENIWVQLNRTQIRIHGLTKEDKNHLIHLPVPIIPDQSKATFKQGTLQIKMPKMGTGRFKDINIRYL